MAFLHDILLGQCADRPDQEAVVTSAKAWSYGKLQAKAGEYAAVLRAHGLRAGNILVLSLERGAEAVALLAACSRLGIAFVPLDPGLPAARFESVLAGLEPAGLVADGARLDGASCAFKACLVGETLAVMQDAAPAATAEPKRLDTDLAYMIFTSGSTGKPKGIMMSQAAASAFAHGLIEHYGLRPGERYASTSPLHFDYCLLDVLLCLGSGGTLLLPNRDTIVKPAFLIEELVKLGARHFSGVPSIWKLALQFAPDAIARLGGLKRIAFAGEHFPANVIQALYEKLPEVAIYNIYGQSESIACTFQVLPRPLSADRKVLPVGTGHRDVEMMLFDESGRAVSEPETVGELYLRGKILFSGYWKDDEATASKLVPHPLRPESREKVFRTGDLCFFDKQGMFYFIGRRDNQVKVYGNRVELEEIEAVLGRLAGVSQACVVAENRAERSLLKAVLVCSEGAAAAAVEAARQACAAQLPSYMCPQSFEIWKEMPLTPNGKVDRKAVLEGLKPTVERS